MFIGTLRIRVADRTFDAKTMEVVTLIDSAAFVVPETVALPLDPKLPVVTPPTESMFEINDIAPLVVNLNVAELAFVLDEVTVSEFPNA